MSDYVTHTHDEGLWKITHTHLTEGKHTHEYLHRNEVSDIVPVKTDYDKLYEGYRAMAEKFKTSTLDYLIARRNPGAFTGATTLAPYDALVDERKMRNE